MRTLPLCVTLLGLAACDATWPYDRAGTWRPTGVVDANIAASVVTPSDLVRGVPYNPRDSSVMTAAVERYRAGKVRPLPDLTTFSQRSVAAGGDNGGGGPAGVGTAAAAAQ